MTHQASILLKDAVPWPGAPRCFHRLWDPAPPYEREGEVGGVRTAFITMPGPINVWGYAVRSTFLEDEPFERRAWERGLFNAMCFSLQYPDPEMGFVPVQEVTEIEETLLRVIADNLGVVI